MAVDVDSKTYYELLGVARDAGVDEIKRAYRDMSRIFHPDSNFYADLVSEPPNEKHIAIFKRLTQAYNTLTDDAKRAQYDQTLLSGTLKGWEDDEDEDHPPFAATQFATGSGASAAHKSPRSQSFGKLTKEQLHGRSGEQQAARQEEEFNMVESLEPISALVRKPKLLDQILRMLQTKNKVRK